MSSAPRSAQIRGETTATDQQLVHECLLGRESAWMALVSRYKNLIFSIPIKYGFTQEEATDIFQAVCLDLVCELARVRDPQALGGWLIRVTHNKCFHQKKERLRYVPSDPSQPEVAVVSEEIPEEMLDQLEQEQQIRKAVRDLNPRCRELVEHLFFELPARPYEEVAKELGLAIGSIGFIRRRCLNKLRDRLEALGIR
jgi:RNA polymerase sigma factor (sigma-70 family)